MNEKLLPDALAHKYGFVADTEVHPNGKWKITAWRHKTIPKPTKAQAQIAIEEYELFIQSEEFKDLKLSQKLDADPIYQVLIDRIFDLSPESDRVKFDNKLKNDLEDKIGRGI